MPKAGINDLKAHAFLSETERDVRRELRKIKSEQAGDIRGVSKLARLQGEKQRLEVRLDIVKKEIAKAEAITLDFFEKHGIGKITIRKTNLYISRQLWAGLAEDVTHEKAAEVMISVGLGEYCAPRLNSQSFSAYMRELAIEWAGEDAPPLTPEEVLKVLPESLRGIIKVSEVFKINARKG
jgi:hypothetical protein